MSVFRIECNEAIPGERGEKVLCQDCRQTIEGKEDEVLWRLLYLYVREAGKQVPKSEKDKCVQIAYRHLMKHPDHTIFIVDMKKLA